MEQLQERFRQLLRRVDTTFIRYLYQDIDWSARLIAITGARGTGKTTMLLQHIRMHEQELGDSVLYVTMDDLYFTTHNLVDLADLFCKHDGKLLVIDEVHKYATWSREIKNIYDFHPELHIIFTASSLLEILRGEADLSRRASIYTLYGLSFREFLEYDKGIKLPRMTIHDIFGSSSRRDMEEAINSQLRPLPAFKEYLTHGYFPFYKETGDRYATQLLQTIDIVLEVDLPATQHIDYYSIGRIRKLFSLIAQQVPVIPNISMLSKEVNVTRNSLLNYFAYLQKAQILLMLEKDATGFKQLAKPEKIYLGNTNYAYALGRESTNISNIRETFFFNQMQVRHTVTYSQLTDFLIDGTYSFEVGGKAKTSKQISSLPNSYRVLDDIEYGHGNALPLWIFGFTY